MAFESPNYTQTPNDLFDAMLPTMHYAELKVTLAVIRATLGYHKDQVRLSTSKIATITGLSQNSVLEGGNQAEKRGTISKIQDGGVTLWVVNLLDHPINLLDQVGQPTAPPSSKEKLLKKTNKEKSAAKPHTPPNPITKEIQAAYAKACGYPVEWNNGNGHAAKWLADNGYTPEDVTACYQYMTADPWWKGKSIHLSSVVKQIGSFKKSKGKGNGNNQADTEVIEIGRLEAGARINAQRHGTEYADELAKLKAKFQVSAV